MKVRTIAALAAAGCAIYLVAQHKKEKAAAAPQEGLPQTGGTPETGNTKDPVLTIDEPQTFYAGQQVLYKGKSGYYVSSAAHPTYILVSTGLVKGKVIADAKELKPA